MEAVLRRLKLKKGEPQDTEARKQLQQDLFAFDQACLHLCITRKCRCSCIEVCSTLAVVCLLDMWMNCYDLVSR